MPGFYKTRQLLKKYRGNKKFLTLASQRSSVLYGGDMEKLIVVFGGNRLTAGSLMDPVTVFTS